MIHTANRPESPYGVISPSSHNPFEIAAAHFADDSDYDLAHRMAGDLRLFIREAWPILEPKTPFVDSWHLGVISEHLTAISDGELRRLLLNIPPRTGKSLSTCVFWPAWEWMQAAHLRYLFGSYAHELAIRDSRNERLLIQSPGGMSEGTIFQRLGYRGVLGLLFQDRDQKPWRLVSDQNVKTRYETSERGLRLATSVGSMVTGEGGDRIVIDDPVNPKQARSDTLRTEANRWWDETMSSRFNNPQAAGVIVMQRLHEDDMTGHLIRKGGWHHVCLPAQYEPNHPFVYPKKVKVGTLTLSGDPRTKAGQLLEPQRLGLDTLKELYRDQGTYAFAGQFQQRPAPADGGRFKAEWWGRYTEVPPQWQRIIASWDMRFSDSDSVESSYVVGQLYGINGSQRYLLCQIRAKLSFTQSLKAVLALNKWKYNVNATLVEDKANGPAVINTLKKKVSGMIPITPEGGKDVRAAALEPVVEAGDFLIPAGDFIPAPPGYEPTPIDEFIGEFSVFPNGTNDDQVDATSQVANWLDNKDLPAKTTSYRPSNTPKTVVRHGIKFKGEQYIDKERK